MGNILVCDDERSICEMLDIALRREGHKVETANSGEAAKRKLDGALYDVIVTDIKMPKIDGIEVLRHAHQISPDSAVILITAVDDYEAAVQAVKAGGATDYIRKSPGLVDEIKLAINRALEKVALSRQNFAFKRDAATRNSLDNIVGVSPAMEKLKQTIRTVASTQSTVLIYGESGTGKELVARALHVCSPRAAEPFVSINCGAFPETLLESELFGYVKGAFTGANQNKRGLFEVADKGTIFLDEISEMSLTMQVKLLRVLQERSVRPVGGTNEIPIDVRVIAATNRDLDKQVADNTFREDLYYRLSVIPVSVPPLRATPRRHSTAGQPLPQEVRARSREEHPESEPPIARSVGRLRMARQCPPTGKYHRARRRIGNRGRTARRTARGKSEGSCGSRRGGTAGRGDHREHEYATRRDGHGEVCCRHREVAAADRADAIERCPDSSRRPAEDFLPVVPASDEEVRTVASACVSFSHCLADHREEGSLKADS